MLMMHRKDNPARATVEAVYQQVISDLTEAAQSPPDAPEDFRAGKYAAEAFLARVYMNMGNYTGAAQMADDVINNSGLSLVSSFDKCFNNVGNSSEDILAYNKHHKTTPELQWRAHHLLCGTANWSQ